MLTTGLNTTINIGSLANIGTLNAGAGSTFILNPGANIGLLNGANGSIVASAVSAPITWNINGSSGTATGGVNIAYNLINSVTGGNGGDIFNISGNVNEVLGGNGLNKYYIMDGATIGRLVGGNANVAHEIDTQNYTPTLDYVMTDKFGSTWKGHIDIRDGATVINFENFGVATARSGAGGIFTVPNDPELIKTIYYDKTINAWRITDPFVFYNLDFTQGVTSLQNTNNVLSYANQLDLFPTSSLTEASQFNFMISNLFDLEALQQQLDLEMKKETEFGCMAP